jgi:hypothetical protein
MARADAAGAQSWRAQTQLVRKSRRSCALLCVKSYADPTCKAPDRSSVWCELARLHVASIRMKRVYNVCEVLTFTSLSCDCMCWCVVNERTLL